MKMKLVEDICIKFEQAGWPHHSESGLPGYYWKEFNKKTLFI
jgi:hypothetical protein